MRKLYVLVGFEVIDSRGEHEGHRVINAVDTTVGAGKFESGGDLVNAEALVDGAGKL